MVANLNMLKIGFAAWLESKNTENDTQNKGDITSDVSLFTNAEAFKEYLSEELNIDFNVQSMSINDILNMEIVNGKLVDSNETETTTKQNNTLAIDLGESETVTFELNAGEQEVLITDILNELMNDETLKGIIDTDANSELSEDEVETFMNSIKGLDGDETNVSIDDVFAAIEEIKEDTFTLGDKETIEVDEIETSADITTGDAEDTEYSSDPSYTSGDPDYSYTPSPTNNNEDSTEKNKLEGMNLEELNKEYDTTQSKLTEQKTTLSNALNGSTPELEALQTSVDEAYDAYKEQLKLIDNDLAKKMEELETSVNNAQADFETKEQDYWEKEGAVNDCTTAYDNAVSKRENLESIVGGLENTDTSDMNDEEKADLSTKLTIAKEQLETAKREEKNAETALENAESAYEESEKAYNTASDTLDKAKKDKTEFEENLLEEHSEIKTYLEAYNSAKETYTTEKETAITNARLEVEVSENYINEIKTAITRAENEEATKEYKLSSDGEYDEKEGQRLVETAKQMLNEFGSSTGYCATGVSRTIQMAYGISMNGNGCDWDTNMEKLVDKGMFKEVTGDYASSTDLANLPAGAVVCWENTGGTNGGGAQYGHVTIADGNGGEISDHYQANIYTSIGGRSDQYRVFVPIS